MDNLLNKIELEEIDKFMKWADTDKCFRNKNKTFLPSILIGAYPEYLMQTVKKVDPKEQERIKSIELQKDAEIFEINETGNTIYLDKLNGKRFYIAKWQRWYL